MHACEGFLPWLISSPMLAKSLPKFSLPPRVLRLPLRLALWVGSSMWQN